MATAVRPYFLTRRRATSASRAASISAWNSQRRESRSSFGMTFWPRLDKVVVPIRVTSWTAVRLSKI